MDTNKIKVMVVEPGNKPFLQEIDNSLEELEHVVGGFIKTIELDENCAIVYNADGKDEDLPPNKKIFIPNEVTEFVYGTFIVAGKKEKHGAFPLAPIDDESIKKCTKIFQH